MAVGGGEIFNGLATDDVVLQLAVDDDVDGFRGHTFVIDRVGADELLAVEGLERGIVGDVEEVRQDGGVER